MRAPADFRNNRGRSNITNSRRNRSRSQREASNLESSSSSENENNNSSDSDDSESSERPSRRSHRSGRRNSPRNREQDIEANFQRVMEDLNPVFTQLFGTSNQQTSGAPRGVTQHPNSALMSHLISSLNARPVYNIYEMEELNTDRQRESEVPDRGLRPQMINSIPVSYYTENLKASNPSGYCSICMVDFEVGDPIKFILCSHFYHADCINEWLAKRSICPDCRLNIRAFDMAQLQ